MAARRKVKVSNTHSSTQNPISYPECRTGRDAQKEHLNKKLSRILKNSKMEIEKKHLEHEQRFKYELETMDKEMKKTRERLKRYQRELIYGRHMSNWFKRMDLQTCSSTITTSREPAKDIDKFSLPEIKTFSSVVAAARNDSNKNGYTKKESDDEKDTENTENQETKDEEQEYLKSGIEYEIKFLSDRREHKTKRLTFLDRNYKRNKERLIFQYLNEQKNIKTQQSNPR